MKALVSSVVLCLVLSSASAMASAKRKTFTYTPEQVFEAALQSATEHHVVSFIDEKHLMFTFETGHSMSSWAGFKCNVLIEPKDDGKSAEMILNPQNKDGGQKQLFSWGAGGRLADDMFHWTEEKLKVRSAPLKGETAAEKKASKQSKQEVALTPEAPHIDASASRLKSDEKPTEAAQTGTVSAVQPQPATATAGVAATVTKPNTGVESLGDAATNTTNPARLTGEATAEISSNPSGADIEIDGNFVGSTPSSVGLIAGEHTLRVSKTGYKRWERTLKTSKGNIKVAATLELIPVAAAGTDRASAEIHQDANPAPRNEPSPAVPSTAISKDDSRPVIAAETSTMRDPETAASSTVGLAEELIGVSFTGNPTARHDGVEIVSVQPKSV